MAGVGTGNHTAAQHQPATKLGINVKPKLWLAIGVALIALLVLLAVKHFGKASADEAAPTPVRAERTRPERGAGRGSGELTVVADPDRKGTLRLEGQVVDAQLDPVAEAAVTISTNPVRIVRSGADGTFHFDDLIGRRYTLVARSDAGAGGPVTVHLTDRSEPVIVRLAAAATVEVTVLDAESRAPVAGATVEIRGLLIDSATTDAAGIALIRSTPAGRYRLAAWSAEHAPTHSRIFVANSSARQREQLTLRRGAAVSGRVVTSAGAPVDRAQVVYASASDWANRGDPRHDAVTTGADGSFRFPALAAGTFRFNASHQSLAPGESEPITLDGTSERSGVEIRLEEGAHISGRVVTADGEGAPLATVRLSARSGGPRFRRGGARQTFADDDGYFEVAALPRKAIDVVAMKESAATSETRTIDLTETAHARDVELRLELDGRIAGRVIDPMGEPVEGAQVRLLPDFRRGREVSRRDFMLRGIATELTDGGGNFAFAGLRDTSYMILASPPGAAPMRRGPGMMRDAVSARPGDEDVEIVMAATGAIEGKIAFADDTVPELFTVATGGFRGPSTPFASKDGAFRLPDLDPRRYQLVIRGPGFDEKRVADVEVEPGEVTDVGTITVKQGRRISGRVVDAAANPVAEATVLAGGRLFGSGSSATSSAGRGFPGAGESKQVTTDDKGEFTIYGVGSADVALIAEHSSKGRSTSISIPGSQQSVFDIELTLLPPGAIEGTVTTGGQPVESALVSVQSKSVPEVRFAVSTGADGRYRFDLLAPDSYLVSATIGGMGPRGMSFHSRSAVVESGATASIDIAVAAGEVTLLVSATASEGEVGMAQVYSVSGPVTAANASELEASLAAREEGFSSRAIMFGGEPTRIAELLPGDYTVCVVPFPVEIHGPEGFEYLGRAGNSLAVFCVATTVAPTPAEQQVLVPVEIPTYVPPAAE